MLTEGIGASDSSILGVSGTGSCSFSVSAAWSPGCLSDALVFLFFRDFRESCSSTDRVAVLDDRVLLSALRQGRSNRPASSSRLVSDRFSAVASDRKSLSEPRLESISCRSAAGAADSPVRVDSGLKASSMVVEDLVVEEAGSEACGWAVWFAEVVAEGSGFCPLAAWAYEKAEGAAISMELDATVKITREVNQCYEARSQHAMRRCRFWA